MSFQRRVIPLSSGPATGAETPSGADAPSPGSAERRTPSIDIHEGAEGLVLEADVPGATEDSLRIELEDNVLNLHARIVRPVPLGAATLHEESRAGEYFRSFILSDEVQKDAIRAELKNGVLRLILPRSERAKARRIEVKTS